MIRTKGSLEFAATTGRKEAEPGLVTRPFSSGASNSATSVAVVHSRSASIVGVTRLQSAVRVNGFTSKTVAISPVPESNINFFSG